VKSAIPVVTLVAVCAASASFAAAPAVTYSPDGRKVMTDDTTTSQTMTLPTRHPASSIIYSNLATKYKKGVYFADSGWSLCGNNCFPQGYAYSATAFTPTANATAMKLEVGITSIGGSEFSVEIDSDANGVPGTALWSGTVKNLPVFGTCCDLAKADIKGGLALTGGTQYWIAALQTKKGENNFNGAWTMGEVDQVDAVPYAGSLDGTGGWIASTTNTPPAFAIYSK
jgi:hypothetical protein